MQNASLPPFFQPWLATVEKRIHPFGNQATPPDKPARPLALRPSPAAGLPLSGNRRPRTWRPNPKCPPQTAFPGTGRAWQSVGPPLGADAYRTLTPQTKPMSPASAVKSKTRSTPNFLSEYLLPWQTGNIGPLPCAAKTTSRPTGREFSKTLLTRAGESPIFPPRHDEQCNSDAASRSPGEFCGACPAKLE